MAIQSIAAQPGEYWVYRLRDSSPSERVLVDDVVSTKTKVRVTVTFDDGRQESVPGGRLRAPWADVESYDREQLAWEQISEENDLDDVERHCAQRVFELLVPATVAEVGWRPVQDTTDIADVDTLSEMLDVDMQLYVEQYASLSTKETLILSPLATVAIAERLCRINPAPVLDAVLDDEQRSWHKCKYGSQTDPFFEGDDGERSPEWEYAWYLRYTRPRHELLRQWCGYRAVTSHERLKAAEAENHRLELLLEDAYLTLERHMPKEAVDMLRFANAKERITPYTVRPRPDRPLSPTEIPQRVVYRTRRRWW